MTATEKTEFSFANLALEPLEPEAGSAAPAAPVKFHADTRNQVKIDRRVTADRRRDLRFQDDRRSGKDRRPKSSWEPGSNI